MPSFADGLGRRVTLRGAGGEELESLRLCAEIGDRPSIQAALVQRAALLAQFRHAAFTPVRRVERYNGIGGGLAVVSEAVRGVRVSDMLRQSERRLAPTEPSAALHLLQQAVAAMAALHRFSRDAFHGALGPERLIVRPDASLVVVEHVLAGALEELQMSRSLLWRLFRIAVPPAAGTIRFDQQTDVMQLGVLALSLFLGRVLLRDEFPNNLADLLETAAAADDRRGRPRLSRPLRLWLGRALHFDPRTAFRTAIEADEALAAAVADEGTEAPAGDAVRRLLAENALNPMTPVGGTERVGMSFLTVTPLEQSATVRLTSTSEDRGSGAERVTRQPPPTEPIQVQVLADLSRTPPAQRQPPGREATPVGSGSRPAATVGVRTPHARPDRYAGSRVAIIVAGLVLLWGVSFLGARAYFGALSASQAAGTLLVESRPTGVDLVVDGKRVGRTPVTLVLPAGEHSLAFESSHGTVVVPARVDPGTQRTERVDLKSGRAHKRL